MDFLDFFRFNDLFFGNCFAADFRTNGVFANSFFLLWLKFGNFCVRFLSFAKKYFGIVVSVFYNISFSQIFLRVCSAAGGKEKFLCAFGIFEYSGGNLGAAFAAIALYSPGNNSI